MTMWLFSAEAKHVEENYSIRRSGSIRRSHAFLLPQIFRDANQPILATWQRTERHRACRGDDRLDDAAARPGGIGGGMGGGIRPSWGLRRFDDRQRPGR